MYRPFASQPEVFVAYYLPISGPAVDIRKMMRTTSSYLLTLYRGITSA